MPDPNAGVLTPGLKTVEPDDDATNVPGQMTAEELPMPAEQAGETSRKLPQMLLRFQVQNGTPVYTENFAHPESGCSWMGVGGQIFDASGEPLNGFVVNVRGALGDKELNLIALSGGALYLGPGGYEFKLADEPTASSQSLAITVLDSQGNQASPYVPFDTYADCSKNVVLINFVQSVQILNGYLQYLPVMFK